MMPLWAILRHDLRSLRAGWLVRIWLGATAFLSLLVVASCWAQVPTTYLIGWLLFPYLVAPWFLVAIVLGADPVSGTRAEALADGILSRPVTRYEYLVGAWLARVVTVVGVYLVVIVPAVVLVYWAKRPGVADDGTTLYGVVASVGVVGLVLTFLVTLGFFLGTLLRRPLLAIVVALFVWFPISLVLNVYDLQELSPLSLNRALPDLLRQPWRADASQADEEKKPEAKEESGWGARFGSVFGLPSLPETSPPPETPEFFQRQREDFSLSRVVLGYTVPTLLALSLTMLSFCWRDL
jgi:hypothetical protein